jgi:hypothetical protein
MSTSQRGAWTGSTLHVIANDQMRGFGSADTRIREQNVVALIGDFGGSSEATIEPTR